MFGLRLSLFLRRLTLALLCIPPTSLRSQGASDVKELIPEFYMDSGPGCGRFLLNSDNLDFGVTQKGERVNDVILPPWAADSDDFIAKCREVSSI